MTRAAKARRGIVVDGRAVNVGTASLIGQGGEAEIHDLGDGTVLKLFKPAEHADYVGDAEAQAAARRRLDEHQHKLARLPAGLPTGAVTPLALARDAGRVVGYVMRRVEGISLQQFGEPRWRRDHGTTFEAAVDVVRELHDLVVALHARGVVIGDFNDLNVLVGDGSPRVHLIDVDSCQFGGFVCTVFSERFVDPRLCDASAASLVPVRPPDEASDWFAFHAMALRTLLLVGPWGGTHPTVRTQSQRIQRRLSVLDDDIVYPRAALAPERLPQELVAHLRRVFHGQHIGPPPAGLFADVHLRGAGAKAALPQAMVGPLRVERIAVTAVAIGTTRVTTASSPPNALWLDAGALWRRVQVGSLLASSERIGGVLGNLTWAFASATFGAGFYRAAGYTVAFVFDPRRGGLDDSLDTARLRALFRGSVVTAHAAIADERAWLFVTLAAAGQLRVAALVLDRRGQILAATDLDEPWATGVAGACAVGELLFVPTDAGIVRVELRGPPGHGVPRITRTFPETASLVSSADRLALGPGALDLVRADDAFRLFLG